MTVMIALVAGRRVRFWSSPWGWRGRSVLPMGIGGTLRALQADVRYEDYCFRCGSFTAIDTATKLCKACEDRWPV